MAAFSIALMFKILENRETLYIYTLGSELWMPYVGSTSLSIECMFESV